MSLFNALVFLVIRLFSSYLGPGLGDILQQIVNSFMTQEDPSDQIKKGAKITLNPNASDAPSEIPPKTGGFDISSLIGGLGGLFGGNNNKKPRPRASRRPTFTE